MTLHVFNPEHEIALAFDTKNITLPHAIQEFKMNLGFIPALWADDGDYVLVDDAAFAIKASKSVGKHISDVHFIEACDLSKYSFSEISPWGWNKCLCSKLSSSGCTTALPSGRDLQTLRMLSSRKQTVKILPFLRNGLEQATCGIAHYAESQEEAMDLAKRYGNIVVKSLWSSSGRGVKYVSSSDAKESVLGWISNAILRQGGVTVEPYYNKVKDFAMEFYSHGNGFIDYCGLSLFETQKGNYSGNLIASEERKLSILNKFIPSELLTEIRQRLTCYLSSLYKGAYRGPFGVDMMIVADGINGFLLDPCVEINMRRTMGHVANSVAHTDSEPDMIMSIVHNVNYMLKFYPTGNCFVKVF